MLIFNFNMDSQLILSRKLSHFECASKQHLVRGFHNPLKQLAVKQLKTLRGSGWGARIKQLKTLGAAG